MLKIILATFLFIGSTFAQEKDFKNMLEISTDGLGIDSKTTEYKSTVDSTNANNTETSSYILLNYARRLNDRLWAQVYLSYVQTKADYDDNTAYYDTKYSYFQIHPGVIYNFNANVLDSFFAKAGFGLEKTISDFGSSRSDVKLTGYSLSVGKRFPLTFIGLNNVSYTIALEHLWGSGDLKTSSASTSDIDAKQIVLKLLELDLFF